MTNYTFKELIEINKKLLEKIIKIKRKLLKMQRNYKEK